MKRSIFIVIALLSVSSLHAAIGMRELGDSLMAFTGFSRVWSPTVRVKNMRVNENQIILRTNGTLGCVSWTPEKLEQLNKKVSRWILGNTKGEVTIYSDEFTLEELITDCGRGEFNGEKAKDLTDKHIALWPSHGLYYNSKRDEWIWQRATLWTTVEDLYSQEYVRLLKRMLINAGASVYIPRAGIEHNETGPSGMPRWAEGARYWLQKRGAGSAIWSLFDNDHYRDDMKCRAMWVNYLAGGSPANPDAEGRGIPIDLCMALHTDGIASGNDSTIIGTLCIYTNRDDDGKKTLGDERSRAVENRNLADWIQTQVVNDLRSIAPEWTRRQLREANYCESRVPVVPTVLVELVSHLNYADMKYGLDPKFRMTAARAMYKGMLRYLCGPTAVVQPLPIEDLCITADWKLQWTPTLDPLEKSAKPTYYMVYIQEDDGKWNVHQTKQTTYSLNPTPGVRYNCYVVAANAGGLSLQSPTVSAYKSAKEEAPLALIIDAFDDVYGPEWFADAEHAGIVPGSYACENYLTCAYIGEQWDFTRTSKWTNDDNCGWGACYRDHAGQITIGNTHDYSALHGRVLQQAEVSYVSSTRRLAQPDSAFYFVDVITGRQRQPLDTTLQNRLAPYLASGGRLLLSGDHLRSIDLTWSDSLLHFAPYAPKATRSGKVVVDKSHTYTVLLEPNEQQLFCAPEGIIPSGENARRRAAYADMRCCAAVSWQSPDGNGKTLVWGFPLEAVVEFEQIYGRSIEWLMQ